MNNDQETKRNLNKILETGLIHQRAGREAEAAVCYQNILRVDPCHADALNLAGILARQEGDLETAERLACKAVKRNSKVATYHYSLGLIYELKGNFDRAISSFTTAIALQPGDADSLQRLAKLVGDAGDKEKSIQLYRRVLDLCPERAEVYYKLGGLFRSQGETETSLDYYRRAVERFPEVPDSHFNLAKALFEANRLQECVLCYQRLLRLSPGDAEAYNCLGRALHELGDLGAARDAYLNAIRLHPEYPEALSNLGALMMDLGELQKGELLLRKALIFNPRLLNAHLNLGSVLARQGRALEAIACFREVLLVEPNNVAALCSLGFTFDTLGDETGAASCFRLALKAEPGSVLAQFNLSSHLLAAGSFADGWEAYELRWQVRQFAGKKREFSQPQWQGNDLRGTRIYVHAEQGYGDTVQFVRYVLLLVELGAEVTLEVQPALTRLLGELHPLVRVVEKEAITPDAFDSHSPLLSLPRAFGTELDNIPAQIPYLRAEQALAATWASRLDQQRLRVGVVWSGNPEHTRDRLRSIPLKIFRHIFQIDGIAFYSLQKGPSGCEPIEPGEGEDLTDLAGDLRDFTDTAAVISNLDLVIAVDTAVAHLAGALGRPVWILLAQAPDWRWLKERTDSPWYPTARLFRQKNPGDWQQVVEEVARELDSMRTVRGEKISMAEGLILGL